MKNKKMGLGGAVSIGIGGMVGGGIFAVLGLAVDFAKGGTPIAFALAGLLVLLTGYSYAKLSVAIPSQGGTVKFIDQTFGNGIFSGGINNLLWMSYIIMLSLYSTAFGSYAFSFFQSYDLTSTEQLIYKHSFISAILLFSAFLNYFSAKLVGSIETWVVLMKLSMLAIFISLGLYALPENPNLEQLTPRYWTSLPELIAGGMIIFLAYEGFELIANTALDIKNPKKNLPRAYYISIGVVIILYILVAIVTVASLPFSQIASAQDYALAAAAKPFMGPLGYTLISITALLSTFSAINATYYGGSRVSITIAEDKELPHGFTKKLWHQPIGLLVTMILALAMANLIDLESISTSGSAGFLLIFAVVNFANFKQASKTASSPLLAILGVILCLLAVGTLLTQQMKTNPLGAWIVLGIVCLSFIIEFLYKKTRK